MWGLYCMYAIVGLMHLRCIWEQYAYVTHSEHFSKADASYFCDPSVTLGMALFPTTSTFQFANTSSDLWEIQDERPSSSATYPSFAEQSEFRALMLKLLFVVTFVTTSIRTIRIIRPARITQQINTLQPLKKKYWYSI